jgi:hypothetical protein
MSRLSQSRLLVAIGFVTALGVASTVASQRTAAGMATAAERFLASLSPAQRQQAAMAFAHDDRTRFNFIPTEAFPRQGLLIRDMNPAQRAAAHELLKAGLSQFGYKAADEIMKLEAVLRVIEGTGGRLERDPEKYFFSVFGTPSPRGAWGYRVEGHHVSLHFTVVNGTTVASSPTFFGTNPAEVREGPQKGTRILAAEEDAARALIMALDASQRRTATMSDVAPNDIATGNTTKIDPLAPAGIKASALNESQRGLLMTLVGVYTSYMADDLAAQRTAKLTGAGVGNITFAWAGPIERGQKHYYRVQGPTFLIEYDNTQNNGNHIHSIWRDYDGDFGRDLLREHLQASAH